MFYYSLLDKVLDSLKKQNINSLKLNILISFSKTLYNGRPLYNFFYDLHTNLLNSSNYINNKSDFKVNVVQIDSGDVLQRHNWYYNLITNYMKKHGLTEEEEISVNTRDKLKELSYQKSLEYGQEWFTKNLDAINIFIPNKSKLKTDFKLNKEITLLYEGDENNPKIEYICYEHWLKHPEYQTVKTILQKICEDKNNILERALKNDIKHFHTIYKKYQSKPIEYTELFNKQSYEYLFDETVAHIIKYYKTKDIIELYGSGIEPKSTLTLKGKKARKDPIIQKYLQNELKGADQRKFVSVKSIN
ncbi:hypothetical protein ACFL0U_04615 [Pseudomonadota bacterium]